MCNSNICYRILHVDVWNFQHKGCLVTGGAICLAVNVTHVQEQIVGSLGTPTLFTFLTATINLQGCLLEVDSLKGFQFTCLNSWLSSGFGNQDHTSSSCPIHF